MLSYLVLKLLDALTCC